MKPEIVPELRPLIERAEAAYQRFYVGSLKDSLERASWGKYVAINIESGAYLVADTEAELVREFSRSFPGAIAYTLRIGSPRLIA